MRIGNLFIATVASAALATSAVAGGLSPEIMEAPVVIEEEVAPAASSINPLFVVAGVVGALLLIAALEEDEEDEEDNGLQDGEPIDSPS